MFSFWVIGELTELYVRKFVSNPCMSNPYLIFPLGLKYVKSNPILKPVIPLSLIGDASSSREILYDEYAKFPSIKTGDPPGIKMNSLPNPFEFHLSSEMF